MQTLNTTRLELYFELKLVAIFRLDILQLLK